MACMKMQIALMALVIVSIALSAAVYPMLPERIASHWNIDGVADDAASKTVVLGLMPGLMIVLALLLWFIPSLDPLKRNIASFRPYYNRFIVLILAFLLYLQLVVIVWNLGVQQHIGQALAPAFAALFYYCGILLQHAKRNWFIGIRTPWTLSSDRVWAATHRRGSSLFKVAGVIALVGALLPSLTFYFVIIPVIAFAIYITIYSYVVYQHSEGHIKIAKRRKRQ